ncbi:MAG: PAS domain S-box protein [Microcoleus sp. PH2017_10_PVI_O_A]|nr:PAS domain S-box protein [Microcoleus sp. PH2017_10_PVI_O_A]MCC3460777.1 PAS domain S-box protein [Microcoleus sp. PH2017_11_PCY_U_A]MCC3479340.1 PAS domain S-box protein [Microcoleus sp. PH2017_12_PCY_D_A]MCC3529130.1 PAS domain S-box protein [Microcoleus sp. PH2017_21_RUC_O_A]MCC3541388.1 PAS domain S-box protein [Microcoleus sp. PH2017_22_RUC_O_B]MCC3560181.1 PAS domain S-box protein [Microcoleus sp. PH2017_27_LUM_O_A]TAE82460.1 MAG: PAS domain S-box protein [Oscillatoriales cyanobacter
MKYLLDRFVHFVWTDRPIRQRGTVIVAIPLICLLASLSAIAGLRDNAIQVRRRVDTNKAILQETNRLLKTVVDAETGIRGYGLTKRREFLEPYFEAKKSLPPLLAKLRVSVAENQLQAQKFEEIKKITEQQINFLQNTLNQLESSATKVQSSARVQLFAKGKLTMDKLREKIDAFAGASEAYQKAQEQRVSELVDLINFLQVAGLLVGCLGAAASWYLFDSLEQELRKREAGLQESKTRIQAVVDNAADGIITLDESGNIESFNTAAEKIFGEKADRTIGSNLRQLIAQPQPDSSAGDYAIEYFVLNPDAKLKTYQEETVGVRSDGTKFPMELAISEMRLANQRLFIAICRDVGGRKQAEETLRKQAQMLDLANDTIAVLDLNWTISYWNLGAKWLYGWRKSEAIGKNLHDLLQTEWPQPFEEIQKVFFERGSWQGELVRTKEDGTKITVASRWTLQRDEQDKPVAILEISNDISDRKRSEIALAESAQRFRDTFEQAAVGMAQASVDGKLLLVNQKLCEILGYSRQELSEKKFQEITWPEDLGNELELLGQLLAGEIDNYCVEKRYVRKDGDLVWANLTVSLLQEQNGTHFLMGVVEDIRERKQAEESLRLRAEELSWTAQTLAKTTSVLRKRNQELDQFAYVVSHDLKAPLRAIANLSSWIEEDLSDSMTEDTLHQMNLLRGRVHRMESLIEGLLQYSRVGRIQVASETVKVGKLLAEIIDSLAPPSGFEVKVEPGMPTFVTERLPLQQVFSNLISNAIKHNRSESGQVHISVKELETFYEFAVADDGPGIAPQYHDKVFVIFQTLEARDKVENTGIGLSLVKKIVESQGGTISLESAEGEGAIFRFTWPKQPVSK